MAGVVIALLAGCSQSPPTDGPDVGSTIDDDVQAAFDTISGEMPGVTVDLVQAAKNEGTVVYYHLANPGNAAMISAFQRTFPFVQVEEFESTGGGLVERYQTEAAAGQVAADIFMGSSVPDVDRWIDQGLVMEYVISNDAEFPDAYKRSGFRYPTSFSTVGIGWNTEQATLTDAQIEGLSSWDGLTDADLLNSNRVGILNIAAGGIAQTAYYIMQQEWGDEIFEALSAKDDLLIYGGSAPMGAALQSGEIAIAAGISDTTLYASFNDGAPVQWVYPEPVAIAPYVQFISADAPHPNAGRLFQEFVFTYSGQHAFASVSTPSFREDVGNLQPVASEPWFSAPTEFFPIDDAQFEESLPGLIETWNGFFGG